MTEKKNTNPGNQCPDPDNLVSGFSSMVKCWPHNPAVCWGNKELTYLDLDALSTIFAFQIKKQAGASPLAVFLPSGGQAVVVMLGILKCGLTYLFLDINDPEGRINDILDSAQPGMVIAPKKHKDRFEGRGTLVFDSDGFFDAVAAGTEQVSGTGCDLMRTGQCTAYVIYTSGSTGRPKGIPIKDRAILNLIKDFQRRCQIDSYDRCSLWTNLNFDVSVYEIWSALLSGGALCIPDQEARLDSEKFISWLEKNRITSAYIPPFMIEALADRQEKAPLALKRILTGVEPISEALLCRLKQNTPGLCLINGYGPAEATVCATLYEVPDLPVNPGNAPIGRAIDNLKVYLLDDAQMPVPNGEKGEIYIAGVQVAEGYLSEKVLTAKSFLPNPFSENLPGFMYRTGDIGVRLSSGEIMYGGRKDFQIKLRGFRIEPGEIENTMREYTGVFQAAVVLKKNKWNREILTAYVEGTTEIEQLKVFLKQRLPRYMVPSIVISLEKMPLTSQDKIDKKQLKQQADLDLLDRELPRTGEEKAVAQVWEQFLNISPVYRNDDFFLLGGDSIAGVKILARLNRRFEKDVAVGTLFENPKLKSFAALFSLSRNRGKFVKKFFFPGIKKKKSPLLHDQDLIWRFEQINPGTPLYHIPLVYHIRRRIDPGLLEQAVALIKARHVALQTRIVLRKGVPIQEKESGEGLGKMKSRHGAVRSGFGESRLHFQVESLEGEGRGNQSAVDNRNPTESAAVIRWIVDKTGKPFDLSAAPLFRVDLLVISDASCVLCLTFHHIVFDGWSAGLFIRELGTVYTALARGKSWDMPDLEWSYYDCVSAKNDLVGKIWKSAYPFFADYLHGLPHGRTTASEDFSGACSSVAIPLDMAGRLRHLALENNTTSFTLLLLLFQAALYGKTGREDQVTGIAYAGRNRVETEPVIGFLMNTLVARNRILPDQPFIACLNQTRQILEKLFQFKDIPFQKISQMCRKKGQAETLFASMFLMQTMDFPRLDLNGAEAEYLHPDMGKANCDITLELFEEASGINGWFEYRTARFSRQEIQRFTNQFYRIIERAVSRPQIPMDQLVSGERFALLPGQEGMVVPTLNAPPGSGLYIVQVVFDISREINEVQFSEAWERVIDTWDNLRLGFRICHPNPPVQYCLSREELAFKVKRINSHNAPGDVTFLKMMLSADRRREFDLASPPLFRVTLVKNQDQDFTCVWSFHRAIADQPTMEGILKDLFLACSRPGKSLASCPLPFRQQAKRIAQTVSDGAVAAELFWKGQLDKVPFPLVLPFKKGRATVAGNRRQSHSTTLTTGSVTAEFSIETSSILQTIVKEEKVTMEALLIGAFGVLLSHYTGKTDFVFGVEMLSPVHGEDGRSMATLVPVRIQIDPHQKLSGFVFALADQLLGMAGNCPVLPGIVEAAAGMKKGERPFDIVFSRNRRSLDDLVEDVPFEVNSSPVRVHERKPFSLWFSVTGRSEMVLDISYDRRLFDGDIVRELADRFLFLLFGAARGWGKNPRLMELSVFSAGKQAEKFSGVNTADIKAGPGNLCVPDLEDVQALISREKLAVIAGTSALTFGDLNRRANQLARLLNLYGAGPGTRTMILLDRDTDIITGLLGVMKSGSACVPVDLGASRERIRWLMDHAAPDLVLAASRGLPEIESAGHGKNPARASARRERESTAWRGAAVICLDTAAQELEAMENGDPGINLTPEDTACILYTSPGDHKEPADQLTDAGSQGKPRSAHQGHQRKKYGREAVTPESSPVYQPHRGVVVAHGSLAAFARSAGEIYDIQSEDRVLLSGAVDQRYAVEEIFPTIASGATLVVPPEPVNAGPGELLDCCRKNRITILHLPATLWQHMVDAPDSFTLPSTIKTIIVGHETAASAGKGGRGRAVPSNIRVIHTFGRAETTGAVTFRDADSAAVSGREKSHQGLTIGTLFPGMCLMVLNHFQQPALAGTEGELYIGGIQISKGYLNGQTGDSAGSFVELKSPAPGGRFFKSGEIIKG